MKKPVMVTLSVLFVLVSACGWAIEYRGGYRDLDMGKRYMDSGQYRSASEVFWNLSNSLSYSSRIQEEASYFYGFCLVKLNDLWGAIRVFNVFLDRFPSSSFTPDALYVLGRTHEELSRFDHARRLYQRCIERFPSSEFARKSRDRLSRIGGGGGDHSVRRNAAKPSAAPAAERALAVGADTSSAKAGFQPSLEQAKGSASKSDPFVSFQPDKARIDRVNGFIAAVEKMTDVEKHMELLSQDDNSLEVVQESLKKFSEKSKFNRLHDGK